MKVAIHQPHYFPWLGYLDKMAKVDLFLVNDEAQLEAKSPMSRNRILNQGRAAWLSVSLSKKDYVERENREIELASWDEVAKRHQGLIKNAYAKAPHFREIWGEIIPIFEKEYTKLIDLDMETILFLRRAFQIDTPMQLYTSLPKSVRRDKNGNMIEKMHHCHGDVYLSGCGARAYMDVGAFQNESIQVVYQEFSYPSYQQFHSESFVPNLSALDILFSCGIEESRRIFWENVQSSHEFDGV